jgi:hypothetical protein
MKMRSIAGLILATLLLPAQAGAATVELLPSQDNTLYQPYLREAAGEGLLSNGAGSYFFAGRILTGELRRGLLAFDVAGALPAGARITEVTLTLQMSKTIVGPTTVSLHRLTADWGEGDSDAGGEEGAGAPAMPGDATWLHTFYDTGLWMMQGGDFDPADSSRQTISAEGLYTFPSTPDLVADVQSWLESPATNYGWIVLGDETMTPSAKRFNSRENGSGSPTLTVSYEAPVPAFPSRLLPLLIVGLCLIGSWLLWQQRRDTAPVSGHRR